jgi:CubicO group peptidase (beta-lactamase class C family)
VIKIEYRRTLHQDLIPAPRPPVIPSFPATNGPSISRFPGATKSSKSSFLGTFLTETGPHLETVITHPKQTTATFLTETQIAHFASLYREPLRRGTLSRAAECRALGARNSEFLTGSGPQTENDVTRSKQTTEKFLTGARTHFGPRAVQRDAFRRSAAVLFFSALFALSTWAQSAAPAASQPPNSANAAATAPTSADASPAALNPGSAASFLDQYFAQHLNALHVPGAVVTVVKDGQVVALKGYGYSNLEKKIPVDAEHTVFRLASVSKVFTATAVLQLVEEGKLRLDENVNDHYLRLFQLDEPYPRAVTLQELLTHTAGFDDRSIGITAHSAAQQIPLGPYLAHRLAARVMLPGDQYSYSNDGFSLAGYIVETQSGEPFAQYIQEHIFAPLAMRNSSFAITSDLEGNLAVGYDYNRRSGRFVPLPLDYPNIVPAVSLVSTASDMTHFMIAELQLGRYGAQGILNENSAQQMFARQYTNDPRLSGTAYAYWEEFPNGVRALRQDGDWMGVVSSIYLSPAEKTGIFVACNTGDQRLINDLLRHFMDRFYPASAANSETRATVASSDPPTRFAGSYRLNRYAHRTIEKLGTLLREWEVFPSNDGAIILRNPNVGDRAYLPAGPLLFRQEGSEDEIAFHQDAGGQIDRLFFGRYVLEKLPWYETAKVQMAFFAFFGCVFGCAVLVGLVAWIRNGRGTSAPLNAKNDRAVAGLRHWTAGVSAANLLFLGGMFLAFLNKVAMAFGLPFYVWLLLCIPLITTAATLVILWQVSMAWRNRAGTASSRAFYSLVALAAVAFIPFLAYWNLLGFHY